MPNFTDKFPKGLIVSCQLDSKEPFFTAQHSALFAASAERGGAVAIRADGLESIQEIRATSRLPVIGCIRKQQGNFKITTPDMIAVEKLARSGVAAIAIDGTNKERMDKSMGIRLIADVRKRFSELIIVADVSSFEEGVMAADVGADAVSMVLFGRTEETIHLANTTQDYLKLVYKLASTLGVPILAEGFIFSTQDAEAAIQSGAYSVIVGAAITRPIVITQIFNESISRNLIR